MHRRHPGEIATPYLALCLTLAAAGCGSSRSLPPPEGFSGKGGLFGGAGVGSVGQTAGKNAGKAGQGGKSGAKAGAGGKSGGAAGLPGNTCAQALADTAPVTPTIWLVVDGSSSMTNNFANGSTRWQALRSTLIDQGGVVDTLQDVAKFGMVIYAGNAATPDNCVQLITVDPALNNLAAITEKYPVDPVSMGTPTDRALEHVVKNLPVQNGGGAPDREEGPVYVVLATDGQPNKGCGDLAGGNDTGVEQAVVDITKQGTEAGVNMYVISLAGNDRNLQNHLNKVAAATVTKTPPFVPSTKSELISTFQKIVNGASCQIDLKGQVDDGAECTGIIKLNEKTLPCNDDNGWRLIDKDTFQLTGTACGEFLGKKSQVNAMFPCEVFRPD